MAGQVWLTADTHFWHAGVIRSCGRPFSDAEAMTEALIARWNARVAADDLVYHLGDFVVRCGRGRAQATLDRLKGRKILIAGNHDEGRFRRLDGWSRVEDLMRVAHGGRSLVLCHYALRAWPGQHRGAVMLHGHSHGRLPPIAGSLDVGVDCWAYAPARLDEVFSRLDGVAPA